MATSKVPIELPADPALPLQAATKAYVDTGLADKAGAPFRGPVPSGTTTPTIVHDLGTADVDVTVYRVSDGLQVGVPADRVDTDSVQLTFAVAPSSGQYRVVVSAGTGTGGGGGGGGGLPDPHASTHASAGADPVTAESIGAALTGHTHDLPTHGHDGLAPAGGAVSQVLTKLSATDYNYGWLDPAGGEFGPNAIKPFPPVTLTPYEGEFSAWYCDIDAALGTHFRVDIPSGEDEVYLMNPTNPTPGQSILLELRASPTVNSAFHFGTSVETTIWTFGEVGVGSMFPNTVDYVVAIYDERAASGAGRWRVLSCTRGFPR